MLLIGIDEAGYGPLLGPLCHGFAAVRVPDATGSDTFSEWDLWQALHPAVSRADGDGLLIDDSKKVYGGKGGLAALEAGVRAFAECARNPGGCIDLHLLLPAEDLEDLSRDFWFEFEIPVPTDEPFDCSKLREAFLKLGGEALAVGARALSPRAYNAQIAKGANKAEASWRVISCELKRLAALSRPDESIFVAIDRQGGRKFYAALISETFEAALVHVECETEEISVYRIEHETRTIRVGFYVDGDGKHLLVALSSMAAKLAREKYMLRFNAFFQRHQPDLRHTAGYYNDAHRFLDETKKLRRKLKIGDRHFIRNR